MAARTDMGGFVSDPGRHRVLRGVLRRVVVLILLIAWIGAVVYPDPRPFFVSIARLQNPPVDAHAAAWVAASLPDDYQAVEQFALEYVPWAPAWTVYGLPWYFPTVPEVLDDRAGDCQARALLLASILEAKDMPYTLYYSFDHVWVDYPGKEVTALEDPAAAFIADTGDGWLSALPTHLPLWQIIKGRVDFHWSPMPIVQKLMVVLGGLIIVGAGERRLLERLRRYVWPGPVRFAGAPRW